MPLTNNTFFKPSNGRYIGDFLGTEDGPRFDRKKDDGTVKNEGTILWNFQLYNQDGTPVVDDKSGQTPAVGQGMTSETVGIGRGVEAKARRWLRALLAAKGHVFDDNIDPNEMVQMALGARVILNFGRSAGGKDGTLIDIEPFSAVPAGVLGAPAPPPLAPGATAAIPAVEPALVYATAGSKTDNLPF